MPPADLSGRGIKTSITVFKPDPYTYKYILFQFNIFIQHFIHQYFHSSRKQENDIQHTDAKHDITFIHITQFGKLKNTVPGQWSSILMYFSFTINLYYRMNLKQTKYVFIS